VGMRATGTHAIVGSRTFFPPTGSLSAFAPSFPEDVSCRDTYDVLQSGVPNAIRVGGNCTAQVIGSSDPLTSAISPF